MTAIPQYNSMAALGPMARFSALHPMTRKKRLPISVRFALRSPKKGTTYSNPHPLQVWIAVDGKRMHFGAFWMGQKLMVDPADWRVVKQVSGRRGDSVNNQIVQMKAYIESIHQKQLDSGATPTLKSVCFECLSGYSPEWSIIHGWVYPDDKQKRNKANQYANRISAESPIDEAYQAYIAHLRSLDNTDRALSRITLGRWQRGLVLLHDYESKTGQKLPTAGGLTIGWAKRYHSWLQTQNGGRHFPQPVSAGQASRFVLKVASVLDWMMEEGWLERNPIRSLRWPKHEDKEVLFLEPEHIAHLLTLDWKGTKGIALWWFLLMCCTGLDYPDAVAYARDRNTYEVQGRAGWKIVGRRKKPPHVEYHLPRLDEVEQLFALYPQGPADISGGVVNRYTDQIEAELGISWRITKKTARKTFGSLMLAAGHRIADVSLMMGHSSITTTERHYVKVRGTSIDRSMERVKVNINQLSGHFEAMEGQGHV
ncbi:tyrosine-type recombinase/integrase [Spirosoma sp. BT702]|uniref:Tyrosine-type recombinase/integrase n=1 Tax=Spirosoma profusum TaxID=2771354 RepID=A0A926XZI2_9BACT|nr:tyrosine-type recombinase/integrase [Spirosoma profusum]MBD2703808.1 tyrosine-type recombinase/integrase [Spirosoma profusum]